MTDQPDPLVQFSNALATRAELAKSTVVAIRLAHGRHITGMAWASDIVVASEQSLPQQDEFELVAPGGAVVAAKIAGRDPSTNIAILRLAAPIVSPAIAAGEARTGAIALAIGADGAGGASLWLPGSGSRKFDDPEKFVKMNGREVFKFATRVMVSSAEAILDECGKTIDDVDVYVPHQANVRIIDHAVKKLGVAPEKTVINVQKYGNTSSGSIPLALADAADDGRLEPGKLVLLTGMGAGLTWGSALIEWTHQTTGAAA